MEIAMQIDQISIARAANDKRTFGGYSLMLQYGLSF